MDRVNHNITRRDFLKFMGLGALATTGLVGGNNPSKQNVEAVPTPNPNVLTSPRPYDEEVTIDYQIAHQRVYTAIDKNGYQIVTGYENPVIDQYQGGFDQNEAQYRWGDEPLPRVEVGNTEYPLLTSLNLKDEELQTISSWYKNSHLIKELLKKLPESGETAPIKVDTLVVNFRSISDDYYMPNSGSSDIGRFVNERDPDYEPLDLFKKTADAIREVSDGFVDYRIKVEETIDEYDMSRTNDPRCAPQELININKYVVNYYEIGKLAIKHETDTVFIYTGPNGGMYESYTWTDPDTKKQILIFGLNYNRDWTQNLHSWM